MAGEEPPLWHLLNLAALLRSQGPQARNQANKSYTEANHPPVEHVSLNGETTLLGQGEPRIRVYAENLDPLRHALWSIRNPVIECRNHEKQRETYYSHVAIETPEHPVDARVDGEQVVILARKYSGLGPGGVEEKRISLTPLKGRGRPRWEDLGETVPLRHSGNVKLRPYSGAGFTAWVSQGAVFLQWGPPGDKRLFYAKPIEPDNALALEASFLENVYNPTAMLLQPYALVKTTLKPGTSVSSNLIILGAGDSWVSVAGGGPIKARNEEGVTRIESMHPLIFTGVSRRPDYTIIPLWMSLSRQRPLHAPCSGPLLNIMDNRIVVDRAQWLGEGREWVLRATLSNPTGTPVLAHVRVHPPHYLVSAGFEGEALVLEDRSNIKVYIGSFETGELEVRLRESRLAQLIRAQSLDSLMKT